MQIAQSSQNYNVLILLSLDLLQKETLRTLVRYLILVQFWCSRSLFAINNEYEVIIKLAINCLDIRKGNLKLLFHKKYSYVVTKEQSLYVNQWNFNTNIAVFFINHNPSERIINKTNKCMIGRYILTFCVGYQKYQQNWLSADLVFSYI